MAEVLVQVNGQTYKMKCEDGEENQLNKLVSVLDSEVTSIRNTVGQVGEVRLLLMAGLVIADKLSEAQTLIEELQENVETLKSTCKTYKADKEQSLIIATKKINQTTQNIEKFTKTIPFV